MSIKYKIQKHLRGLLIGMMEARGTPREKQGYVLLVLFPQWDAWGPTGAVAKLARECLELLKGRMVVLNDQRAFDELNELRGLVLGLTSNMPRPPSMGEPIPMAAMFQDAVACG